MKLRVLITLIMVAITFSIMVAFLKTMPIPEETVVEVIPEADKLETVFPGFREDFIKEMMAYDVSRQESECYYDSLDAQLTNEKFIYGIDDNPDSVAMESYKALVDCKIDLQKLGVALGE